MSKLDDQNLGEWTARKFHELYEKLAPKFGYLTRQETAVPWESVPETNKQLMIAVSTEVIREHQERVATLFDAIKHGDDEHQAWLKGAIAKHFGLDVSIQVGEGNAPAKEEPRSKEAVELDVHSGVQGSQETALRSEGVGLLRPGQLHNPGSEQQGPAPEGEGRDSSGAQASREVTSKDTSVIATCDICPHGMASSLCQLQPCNEPSPSKTTQTAVHTDSRIEADLSANAYKEGQAAAQDRPAEEARRVFVRESAGGNLTSGWFLNTCDTDSVEFDLGHPGGRWIEFVEVPRPACGLTKEEK